MNRREFFEASGFTAASLLWLPNDFLSAEFIEGNAGAYEAIEMLRGEPPMRAEIKVERGGPRLFLHDTETYPFLALSTHMYPTVENFRQAGIHAYHPILGLQSGWLGPDEYDWSVIDTFLGTLLTLDPQALFLPRLQLDTPAWWKKAHPSELIQYALPTNEMNYDLPSKKNLKPSEGGYYFDTVHELWEASFASELWRKDTGTMLRAFLRHMESSPLKSRMIGYHPTTGRTAEWNYYGSDFYPDYSEPMKRACGTIPDTLSRTSTTAGLLRDPAKERPVMEFYEKFHSVIADTVLAMARVIKEETQRRVLCGVFYGYLVEQVRIQDEGYLATQKVFDSPDLDYIASPYTYQPGNVETAGGVKVQMSDGAGNILGSARGLGGDAGCRVLTESLRRRGKMYFSEMDPSTNQDSNPHKVIGGHGGLGSDTLEGSKRILQRDLGQVFASGVGGWLFDFGPLNNAKGGWYSGEPIISEIRRLVELGEKRKDLDISPVSEIAAVYDFKSFFATQHWIAEKPWKNYGIRYTDFFNHWFLNTQARAFHRIGAPMDFLFRFDLVQKDVQHYKLLFMVNVFLMTREECELLKGMLRNSGITVVWYFAPGYVTPGDLDLSQMESLTGFRFRVQEKPGPMMIRCDIRNDSTVIDTHFGVNSDQSPRFTVLPGSGTPLGYWLDNNEVAFASTNREGYTSVYVGSAPMPMNVLRWLAREAGAALWSSEPDIVRATKDAAMVVASKSGRRTVNFPRPLASVEGGPSQRSHVLEMEFGEVRIFAAEK
ncbi:MAG: hypothetical protein WEB33_01465 [Bacteroidota bacterium]